MVAGANPAARLIQDTKLGFKLFGKSERFKLRTEEKLRGIGEIMDRVYQIPSALRPELSWLRYKILIRNYEKNNGIDQSTIAPHSKKILVEGKKHE